MGPFAILFFRALAPILLFSTAHLPMARANTYDAIAEGALALLDASSLVANDPGQALTDATIQTIAQAVGTQVNQALLNKCLVSARGLQEAWDGYKRNDASYDMTCDAKHAFQDLEEVDGMIAEAVRLSYRLQGNTMGVIAGPVIAWLYAAEIVMIREKIGIWTQMPELFKDQAVVASLENRVTVEAARMVTEMTGLWIKKLERYMLQVTRVSSYNERSTACGGWVTAYEVQRKKNYDIKESSWVYQARSPVVCRQCENSCEFQEAFAADVRRGEATSLAQNNERQAQFFGRAFHDLVAKLTEIKNGETNVGIDTTKVI